MTMVIWTIIFAAAVLMITTMTLMIYSLYNGITRYLPLHVFYIFVQAAVLITMIILLKGAET